MEELAFLLLSWMLAVGFDPKPVPNNPFGVTHINAVKMLLY
jgi:hypothetical protein